MEQSSTRRLCDTRVSLDHGVGRPWLPLDHTTGLPHLSQGACEDANVRLRGHMWPRQSARSMLSLLGFHMVGVMKGYILWAISASAEMPILYRCFRPMWNCPDHFARSTPHCTPAERNAVSTSSTRNGWHCITICPIAGINTTGATGSKVYPRQHIGSESDHRQYPARCSCEVVLSVCYPKTSGPITNWTLICGLSFCAHYADSMAAWVTVELTGGYCWSSSFHAIRLL